MIIHVLRILLVQYVIHWHGTQYFAQNVIMYFAEFAEQIMANLINVRIDAMLLDSVK